MTPTKFQLGSVSSGTMRPQDLIPYFISKLDDLKEAFSLDPLITSLSRTKEVARLDAVIANIESRYILHSEVRDDNDPYWDSEDANHDLKEILFEELEAFTPPFCYFGSHPGDGADYGFWVSEESIEESKQDGDLLRVNDLSEADGKAQEGKYVLVVNDHGNMTLYETTFCTRPNGENYKRYDEIWSVV